MNHYESALREAGLLSGAGPTGHHEKWFGNAARRTIAPLVIAEIGAEMLGVAGSVTLASALGSLDRFEEITDPRGKSYFLLPPGINGHDARQAALLTYVLNAGTDYGMAAVRRAVTPDFPETPYSAAEVRRIRDRQQANSWTYDRDVRFVDRNGGRLVTTPNGILMGLGGNWLQRLFSARGGTTWGDIFMVNAPRTAEPARLLRDIIGSRHIDLDRLLHHEERHCAQWASLGHAGMLRAYGWELVRELVLRRTNRLEADAGLRDGGYR